MKELIVVKHVPFEGPGFIGSWAGEKSIDIVEVNAWDKNFPKIKDNQGVVLMGGPMSVNDDLDFIKKEEIWVKNLLEKDTPLLGVCLGAQMIAKALGGSVYKSKEKEVGWFPIYLDEKIEDESLLEIFRDQEIVFHWHGEIFDTPKGSTRLFFNGISPCQGFYKGRAVGFQFHMETTLETAKLLIDNCPEDIEEGGDFVESELLIMNDSKRFEKINTLMSNFLDWWMSR